MDIIKTSFESLEWDSFLSYYKSFCKSDAGKEKAKNLKFPSSQVESESLLSLTSQGVEILDKKDFSCLSSIESMDIAMKRLSKALCLSSEEIYAFSQLISITRQVMGFFSSRDGEKYELWQRELKVLVDLSLLQKPIKKAISEEGKVVSTASKRLSQLRKEEQKIQESAEKEIKRILKKAVETGLAQDNFYDIRNKRYVIPLKREHKREIPGLYYERSLSQATVYLEPEELRIYNDRLQQIQVDIEEEIYRILQELSKLLFLHSSALERNYHSLVELDLGLARARMAKKYLAYKHASPFSFSSSLDLAALYHPLLESILSPKELIGSDFSLSKEQNTVIISGPNTGGKTVFLKALGINALMSRAGFWLSCKDNASIPYFDKVLAHIGDEQSIEENLSSFSSSIFLIKEILEKADSNTLVLIDEILSSTDPIESSVLSSAILESLSEKNSITVVSTHFSELKAICSNSDSFMSASMEFDVEKMEPLYRLKLGLPGKSWALETAKRIGLDEKIILNARSKLSKEQLEIDKILSSIKSQEMKLKDKESFLKEKEDLLENEIQKLKQAQGTILLEKKKLKKVFREQFEEAKKKLFYQSNDLVKKYREMIKDFPDLQKKLKQERKKIEKRTVSPEIFKEEDTISSINSMKKVVKEKLLPGLKVFVQSVQKEAVLQNSPNLAKKKSKEALVEINAIKLSVPWEDLRLMEKDKPSYSFDLDTVSIEEFPSEINLLGMRVEEALCSLEAFLDSSALSTREKIKIIHGHGSGALKRAIRNYLKGNPYGFFFRAASKEDGGDACTIVFLKEIK